MLVSTPVRSAVFNIPEGDTAAFSAAVDAANSNGEADTILLSAGNYELVDSDPYSFFQISSQIEIRGEGRENTFLERKAEFWFNFFSIDAQGELKLHGLTLSGGYSGSAEFCGGAINIVGGKLSLEHCRVRDNISRYSGGAICSTEAQVQIENCDFVNNGAGDYGGAVLSRQDGVLLVSKSSFSGNEAARGGAINIDHGQLLISDSHFISNISHGSGGGISTDHSGNAARTAVEIVRTTIKGNVARIDGGGIDLHTAQANISRSTVSSNSAGRHGGGIYSAFGSLNVTNSTLSANQAGFYGGGIMVHGEQQQVGLNNLTIAYNVAGSDGDGAGEGGGIYNAPGRRASLSNSILAGNTASDNQESECAGTVVSAGYNLLEAASPGCDLENFPSNISNVNPLLRPLANYGGLTDTHALGPGSPAIDAGSPTSCEESDQRGVPRNCDIGAFEAGPLLPDPGFVINAGLNDAWYNPATDGQGFFVIAFPEIKELFLSWFTYDTERPGEDVTAILGEPGHRWLTAQGSYADNQATLDLYTTSGGVFDSAEPAPSPRRSGSIVLDFSSCNRGTVSYDVPSIGLQGIVPIERIVLDNVDMCLLLQPESESESE
jgi:predicted outer membrane repeat protein